MRQYKAVVIDGRKLLRRTFLVMLLGSLLLFLWLGHVGQWNIPSFFQKPQQILTDTVPVFGGSQISVSDTLKQQSRKLLSFFLQFDWWDPATVLAREIPLTKAVTESGLARLAPSSPVPVKPPDTVEHTEFPPILPQNIPPERQAPIKEVNAAQKPKGGESVVLGNETSYQVDTETLLLSPPSITMTSKGPKVLVIHTHATEAYAPEGASVYDIEGNDRSEDATQNVVQVGNALVRALEKKGIETIHDTKHHDTPSFNGSYASSLKAMESYLKKYPSIQVILDIHRDSIVYGDGTKARVVTDIGEKKAAQLMFVVGTDQKGLEHPNWQENIKSAVHFQNAICKKYPTLMRHINLRRERFNGHTSNATMIIEAGSSGNSLSEAVYSITLAGECIGDYLNSLK